MKRCLLLLILTAFPAAAMAEVNTLEEALSRAYAHDPALEAERAKLRATDEQISQALSNYRPNIDATAQAGRTRQKIDDGGFFSGDNSLKPRDAGLNITQPVFRGFRTQNSVASAKALSKAGQAALLQAEQQLMFDTAKAYLDVVQAQELLAINQKSEADLQEQLDITRDRLRIGELKKTDVSQAESRFKLAHVARLQAQNELDNKRVTFSRFVGEMPGVLSAPKTPFDIPDTLDTAIILARQNNPDIIAASYNQQAARADVKTAEGSLLPEVNIVGNANRGKDENVQIPQQQDNYSLMAKLTIPLYRSGADYSKARAAKQTKTQRDMELQDAENKAEEAARTAWQTLQTARAAITGNQEALEATDQALFGVKEEAKVGTRTTLDILNAEQELQSARIGLAKAVHDEAIAVLQVKASVGQLTAQRLNLDIKIYDPNDNYNKARNKWAGLDIKP